MHHVGRDELTHARWKSRRLLAVVSLPFGVEETNCSQGKDPRCLQNPEPVKSKRIVTFVDASQ